MFERFTERARRVIVLAQEEARLLRHDWIGTEHLLLGLLREEEGVAAKALAALGVSLARVRQEVEQIIGPGEAEPQDHVPFTPRSKTVLEHSLREALLLGHNYIGTEHILLGLIREGEGVAAQVLAKLDADLSRVRQEVIDALAGFAVGPRPSAGPARTPAAARAGSRARHLAGNGRLGTHHQLLALLWDDDSLAAKVLASFGVTLEQAEERVGELGVEGTSDEPPEEAGARRIQLRVTGQGLEIVVDDPELVEGLTEMTISGAGLPGARFPELWTALRSTTRHLAQQAQATPEPRPEARGDEHGEERPPATG